MGGGLQNSRPVPKRYHRRGNRARQPFFRSTIGSPVGSRAFLVQQPHSASRARYGTALGPVVGGPRALWRGSADCSDGAGEWANRMTRDVRHFQSRGVTTLNPWGRESPSPTQCWQPGSISARHPIAETGHTSRKSACVRRPALGRMSSPAQPKAHPARKAWAGARRYLRRPTMRGRL